MTTPRRRVLRPIRVEPVADPRQELQIQKRRTQLEQAHASIDRWMTRLRRAFNAIDKQRRRAIRLERQISQLEQR